MPFYAFLYFCKKKIQQRKNTMKDSPNEKKTYAPPQLTVVTFKMEQGFTASNELTGTNSVILGEWLFGNNSQGEYVGRTEYGSAFGETWN